MHSCTDRSSGQAMSPDASQHREDILQDFGGHIGKGREYRTGVHLTDLWHLNFCLGVMKLGWLEHRSPLNRGEHMAPWGLLPSKQPLI